MSQQEVIVYRGETIDVSQIRKHLQTFLSKEWYNSPEKIEREVQKQIILRKREIGRMTGARYDKNGGYHLAFYFKQTKLFPKAFETKVTDHQGELIVRKLLRHFDPKRLLAKEINVWFYGHSDTGCKTFGGIRLSHNPSIGLICHEVGHVFHSRHDKKLMKLIAKFVKYSEKHGYWLKEVKVNG